MSDGVRREGGVKEEKHIQIEFHSPVNKSGNETILTENHIKGYYNGRKQGHCCSNYSVWSFANILLHKCFFLLVFAWYQSCCRTLPGMIEFKR